MLHRVIYVSEMASPAGLSTVALADILGASSANNRRDDITSGLVIHGPYMIQAIEGARADVERLMRRLRADARHRNMRIVADSPVRERRLSQPLCLCQESAALLARAGLADLEQVGANDAERILDARLAA